VAAAGVEGSDGRGRRVEEVDVVEGGGDVEVQRPAELPLERRPWPGGPAAGPRGGGLQGVEVDAAGAGHGVAGVGEADRDAVRAGRDGGGAAQPREAPCGDGAVEDPVAVDLQDQARRAAAGVAADHDRRPGGGGERDPAACAAPAGEGERPPARRAGRPDDVAGRGGSVEPLALHDRRRGRERQLGHGDDQAGQ
jgi:hypothetical protein